MVNIENLIGKVKKYNPRCNNSRIKAAYDFANNAHSGQFRKSGESFIVHPLAVADALTAYKADEDTIIAALLHDVIEDTEHDFKAIQKHFGEDVAFLVEGVTKVKQEFKKMAYTGRKMESMRKLISSIARDHRVLLIKLLDRRHNMQTIHHLSPKKQIKVAHETLDYYVPLAKSISLWDIKAELENMSFKVLKPVQYTQYQKLIKELTREYRGFFLEIKKDILKAFADTNIPIRFDIMILTPYEILELKQRGLDVKRNFFQIMIRTDSEEYCYLALGVIHKLWKPILKYFSDHVAVPKQNHYQALHTSVIGNKGQLLKILIQTEEMYDYSRKSAPFDHDSVCNLKTSLGQIDKNEDSEYYLKSVTEEVFCDFVHFFDYEGNSYKLPKGASLIDFYFYVQELQNKTSTTLGGTFVNDHKVPLNRIIQDDDVIRFRAEKGRHKISPFFLRYAKTSLAKQGIRNVLARINKQEAISEGKKILKSELERTGLQDFEKFSTAEIAEVVRTLGLKNRNDLFEKLGRGTIDSSLVVYSFYALRFNSKPGSPASNKAQYIGMRIINNKNRVGFAKDILDTFQQQNISIQEIKGYSPRNGKLGIVDLKIHERINPAAFRNTILPLCNALEQIDSVSSVLLDFALCKYDI
jgi:GTP diphosphokinase / guanosine-3',5'-bis(diphosphate) 3'-diphosphatase